MCENEEALFRPVLRGILRPEALIDCSVDLQFVMLLNEAMDVESENDYRAHEFEARRRSSGKR